jgi:hypothetical protein
MKVIGRQTYSPQSTLFQSEDFGSIYGWLAVVRFCSLCAKDLYDRTWGQSESALPPRCISTALGETALTFGASTCANTTCVESGLCRDYVNCILI